MALMFSMFAIIFFMTAFLSRVCILYVRKRVPMSWSSSSVWSMTGVLPHMNVVFSVLTSTASLFPNRLLSLPS